jgi:hypothetical protein
MTIEELKSATAGLAVEIAGVAADVKDEQLTGTGGGSRHRDIPGPLRQQFIAVRSELYQRGVFDPILARFDSGTVTQASLRELAEELAKVAESLH